MVRFLRKYWLEILIFAVVLAVLLICVAPSPTWVNTDSDGIHNTYAAQNLYLSHHTSMPLYLLVGHLFIKIPFGTEFWRLALLSVFATIGACIFIYLIIREHLKGNQKARWYAIIGVLVYGGSALVISQSTIVETYALVTMLGVGAYYFYLKRRWNLCALMLGLGLSVHLLAGIPLLVLFIFCRELRRLKPVLIIVACLLLYLYIPLSSMLRPEQPDMWGNRTLIDMLKDLWSTYGSLFGSLAIYDLPKRILDAVGVLGVSLGLAIVPIGWYLYKNKKLRSTLFWLFVLPIIMFLIGFPPQTYVYLMPSIAIGSIIVAMGLSKLRVQWAVSVFAVAVILLAFNANYFDIGRRLDPELSATEYYNVELAKVPDGQILMPYYGWEWAAIFSYNKNENRSIIPICRDTLLSPVYQEMLREEGIEFEDDVSLNRVDRVNFISQAIVRLNDNVWTTVPTIPETYGCEVVLAEDSMWVFSQTPSEPSGQIHWKPSSPYSIITGSLEVEEWRFLTMSNWNVGFFGVLACIGLILNWLIFILPAKRAKKEEGKILGGKE